MTKQPLKKVNKGGGYTYTEWCEQNPHNLDTYLGNPMVKRHGVKQPWTDWEMQEYLKCSNDCAYFTEKYCKVIHVDYGKVDFKLYPYQHKMIDHFNNNRFSVVLACRQSGKSISSVAYLLWYALFHSDKLIAVLANKGSTAKEMLSRITLMLENLPFFLQPGTKALNKGSVEFSNDSRIEAHGTSSSSIRGKSVSLMYLDEFAFVQDAETFYTSTYPVISSGKNSKVIITSTANGIGNPFYRIWEGAVQGVNEYKPFRVDWWDVPGRDEAWKKSTISNTSEEQFEQEFGNNFQGSMNTLINSSVLLTLKAQSPIQAVNDIKIYSRPEKDHKYLITVDPAKGRGQDYSAITVTDVTQAPFKQVATYRNSLISPVLLPEIIVQLARYFNQAYVVIESNDQGSLVYRGVYYEHEYENIYTGQVKNGQSMGLEMNKKVKRIGCSNLKDLIEQYKLQVVDKDTIEELTTFEHSGQSWEARDGCHDDMVMTLVSLAWFVNTNAFGYMSDDNLKAMMSEEKQRLIEESVPVFGQFMNGKEEDGLDIIQEVESTFGNERYAFDEVMGKEFGVVVLKDEDADGTNYLF